MIWNFVESLKAWVILLQIFFLQNKAKVQCSEPVPFGDPDWTQAHGLYACLISLSSVKQKHEQQHPRASHAPAHHLINHIPLWLFLVEAAE